MIDLDANSVSLIGAAGVFAGDTLGWSDIALSPSGTLFALSRWVSESDGWAHLYRIDPQTGGVIDSVGSTDQLQLSDIDFAPDSLFGSGFGNVGPGSLFKVDTTTAQVEFIPPDTVFVAFGDNPFDTIGSNEITPGGFAVHPTTGDFWGIENEFSAEPVIYRINRTTGAADMIVRLGLGGDSVDFGFDGLHILSDGTFLATRGHNPPNDSVLYEIVPAPDATSGLAEIAPISLTFDTLIQGNLNGLEDGSPPAPPAMFSLVATTDTSILHPWVPSLTVNGLVQALRAGDTAHISVSAKVSAIPQDEVGISVWAELLPATGGHPHRTDTLNFDSIGVAENKTPNFGDLVNNPWTGFFVYGATKHSSFQDSTTSGQLQFAFVAGVVSGEVEIVVQTQVDSLTYTERLPVAIRVPGLTNDTSSVSNVLFVGGTATHPQGTNFHATPDVASRMGRIAARMHVLAGANRFLQHNDASLPWGGTFTVNPNDPTVEEVPTKGRVSHSLGVDIDIGWCFAADSGYTAQQTGRVGGTTCGSTAKVDVDLLELMAQQESACAEAHDGNADGIDDHYHIRFTGVCPS